MKTSAVLLALFFGGMVIAAPPAGAADISTRPHAKRGTVILVPGGALPFPRSERSQAVWASSACWSGCQSFCTWGEAACIHFDEQGNCLLATDHCDRVCQRECRTQGGPFVPDIFDF